MEDGSTINPRSNGLIAKSSPRVSHHNLTIWPPTLCANTIPPCGPHFRGSEFNGLRITVSRSQGKFLANRRTQTICCSLFKGKLRQSEELGDCCVKLHETSI
jgi:hypothetical protein